MKVRFSTLDEYVEEITKDADHIEDRIIRITAVYEPTTTAPIISAYAVAHCLIRGKIVELRQFCGQWLDVPHEDQISQHTQQRAMDAMAQMRTEAVQLNLDVRAGIVIDA